MAKKCINCGNKIRFTQKTFDMPYTGYTFCENCSQEASALLTGIMILSDKNKFEYADDVFEKNIAACSYSDSVKELIRAEYARIRSIKETEVFKKNNTSLTKIFRASFEDSFEMIMKTGEKIFSEFSVPQTVVAGDVKTAVFAGADREIMMRNSFTSLTVILVNRGGISVVTTCAIQDSFGAADECVFRFWSNFVQLHPEIDLQACMSGDVDFDRQNAGRERIGVLGGTFDPIHIGHKALGEAAIREAGLKKLIVMPAHVQPFKQGKRVTEDHHRLAMAKLAFEGNEKAEVSSYEIENTSISYSYDTLVYLRGVYPDEELFFVMGTDSFLMLEDWYKGPSILENFSVIVSVRPGYDETKLDERKKYYKEKYGTNIIKVSTDMPDISATEIRDSLRRKGDGAMNSLVPEAVERYIIENGLYN